MKVNRFILNICLLTEIFLLAFVSGFLPVDWIGPFIETIYTLIYLTCALMISQKKRILFVVAAMILLRAITLQLGMEGLSGLLSLINFIFFLIIVIWLINKIARSVHVTRIVILEAINGYMLIGILFAALVTFMTIISPGSFTMKVDGSASELDIIYYTFVTVTTLGYGDLVPVATHAKSLAILIAISGQIYMTVIIALLVGKYVGAQT